jgi:hypothetical protein
VQQCATAGCKIQYDRALKKALEDAGILVSRVSAAPIYPCEIRECKLEDKHILLYIILHILKYM